MSIFFSPGSGLYWGVNTVFPFTKYMTRPIVDRRGECNHMREINENA